LTGDSAVPANSRSDFDFARIRTSPSGITCHTSRVPGVKPSAFLTRAGTVVRPLVVSRDSAINFPLDARVRASQFRCRRSLRCVARHCSTLAWSANALRRTADGQRYLEKSPATFQRGGFSADALASHRWQPVAVPACAS
jgi:hypothetical protein